MPVQTTHQSRGASIRKRGACPCKGVLDSSILYQTSSRELNFIRSSFLFYNDFLKLEFRVVIWRQLPMQREIDDSHGIVTRLRDGYLHATCKLHVHRTRFFAVFKLSLVSRVTLLVVVLKFYTVVYFLVASPREN